MNACGSELGDVDGGLRNVRFSSSRTTDVPEIVKAFSLIPSPPWERAIHVSTGICNLPGYAIEYVYWLSKSRAQAMVLCTASSKLAN